MTTYAAVALATLWSVTFGYEPSADADVGYDYIVQVEPELLEEMQRGELPPIEANIPPEVSPVRRVRIVVGRNELPKKLRPPVGRAAMRPNIDSDSASTLLAQTGPAGVYGRTPTGFQNAPAGASSTSTATTTSPPASTVPPPGTRYQAFGYANPPIENTTNGAAPAPGSTWSNGQPVGANNSPVIAGQPGVVDSLSQARDNLRGITNNLSQAGTQVLDTTRQVLGDAITPPEYTGYDAQGRPLANLTERLQSEVRNTAEALHDPWDRPATTPTANHVSNQGANSVPNVQQQPQNNWTTTTSNPAGTTSNGNLPSVSSQPNYPPVDYRNDRYAQEQSVLSQGQSGAGGGNIQLPLLDPPNVNTNAGQYAPAQNRQPVDLNSWAATRDASTQPTSQVNTQPRGPETSASNVNAQQPQVSLPKGNDWQGNAGSIANAQPNQYPGPQVTPVSNPQSPALPEVTSGSSLAAANGAPNSDLLEFGTGGNTGGNNHNHAHETAGAVSSETGGATMLNVLAWMVAAGSVAGNLFQWGSIVDLRNKYRVALRRNSPGFGRSMAA